MTDTFHDCRKSRILMVVMLLWLSPVDWGSCLGSCLFTPIRTRRNCLKTIKPERDPADATQLAHHSWMF